MQIFESQASKNKAGQKCSYFSLTGNVSRKGLVVTGYNPTRLGDDKQDRIRKALTHPDTDKVYRRGNRIFKFMLNGSEREI